MLLSLSFVAALGLGLVEGLSVGTRDDPPLVLRSTAAASKVGGNRACSQLATKYSANTFLPDSSNYTLESNTDVWSSTCILSPSCVFTPATVQDLAGGLAIIRQARSPFAVRSGGHMPVPGAQSTDVGVMIGMTNFRTTAFTNGKSVAQIGTGLRWSDVYKWVSPYGYAVAGGRYAQVGVGGLLLGGGINNFGNSYGWSFSNVVGYEAVLPNSSIIYVTASSYPDLFWALKGGGNNFAIVTRFDIKTIPITNAYTGITAWGAEAIPKYVKAIGDFMAPGGGIDDPLTQINPTIGITPQNGTLLEINIPFVAGNTTNPRSLENFTAIPPTLFNTLGPRSNWASGAIELAAFNIIHKRELFLSVGLKADPRVAQLAYETVIFSARDNLKNVVGSDISVAYQPISRAWLQAAKNAGGDAIDLDPADGSFCSTLIAYHWDNEADDEQMIKWGQGVLANLTAKAKAMGLFYPFIYMNDAYAGQNPYPLYGKGKSLPKLLAVQKKYDRQGFFKNFLASGFKLEA